MTPGLGARRGVALLNRYRSAEAIFRAPAAELIAEGLPGAVAQTIASGCAFEEAAEQHARMRAAGAKLVTYFDAAYPALLKQIFDPPILLFARGRLELLQKSCIGVVGTRRPTPYGLAATERLARELAEAGVVIISGMARGIDTAAHRAALGVGGDTIAVFGSGVDHIYPAENRKLAEELAGKGLLLSEFPMGNPGHPQNFPVRNRIIAGMSHGVMVVEGAQYSGSAITASLAMEQGREVFAVPGNITSKMSWAPNLLIKQGAKLVQSAEDVLAELAPEVRRQLRARPEGGDRKDLEAAMGPNAGIGSAILAALKVEEATQVDVLLDRLDAISASSALAALFELQLLGLVKQLPGRQYVRVWQPQWG